ncbi:aminopeptidase P family protein [Allobranchiibius sp. GilTou73]|uniref:aminopeptidase P family protein n=1 Tax=Allobranchiibius sp. GilTou73 TaxID=2904523 RepID=UPI001F34B8C1|nr:aminopeptidase P family protein [Allobranchiibius sp. GilTou73]UIJ34737.1 aminopeptidase P family protein [Allobranchiibius sp. GilTou73]
MSEKQPAAEHRSKPTSAQFRSFVASGWAPRPDQPTPREPVADHTGARRDALGARFPGERLVIPAGGLKVRSNDCDYVFRPHTAFAHQTGLGGDREPDAVLVLEPTEDGGHEATIYFRPLAGRDTEEFFGDSRYGEFWVGARPRLEDVESELGIGARHIDELKDAVSKDAGEVTVRVVRDADAEVTALIDEIRAQTAQTQQQAGDDDDRDRHELDDELARVLSTQRLVKDDFEIDQMRAAVSATARGFESVIADLPDAVRRGRGERWVEGVFGLTARHEGNGVGYDSICAAGDHATTLHWIRNTGEIHDGDLLLLDAGVEVDALYTADITRTFPVNGRFSDAQRKVYDAVYAAQEAGLAAVRPGATFADIHAAAIRVIAQTLFDWGLLPDGVDVETTLDKEQGQYHRRWMVHGTSHHLGLDVHDCARARDEDYMQGTLTPGMIVTVEPGLYFKADDELIPPELRGIGVRIEDDVLVTATGHENLSAAMPRASAEVEDWIARVWAERS